MGLRGSWKERGGEGEGKRRRKVDKGWKRKEEDRIDKDQVDKDKDYPKCDKKKENDDDMMVTLSPMEIRAFIMEVTY